MRRLVRVLCQVGFVTTGGASVLVSGVLVGAGATVDPGQATGLDGAVRAVAAARYGPARLTVVAVGTGLSSVYCSARARHPVS